MEKKGDLIIVREEEKGLEATPIEKRGTGRNPSFFEETTSDLSGELLAAAMGGGCGNPLREGTFDGVLGAAYNPPHKGSKSSARKAIVSHLSWFEKGLLTKGLSGKETDK